MPVYRISAVSLLIGGDIGSCAAASAFGTHAQR